MKPEIADSLAERIASGASYVSSSGVAAMGLTLQEWYGLFGLVFVVLTYLTSTYYKHKTFEHQKYMREREAEKTRQGVTDVSSE